ncbi:MAG: tRNA pseudouridine(38-40) synthase TruA [Deltaproteobacteria bacterium GWC2_42_11]|nr:MAG: tRNA pseudouridine(38-40) synthase TruA [Deltaproteobacteria bacterium GWC2_42_11]
MCGKALRNIKLLIEYEGTNYVGWQEQQGLPAIQGTLQDKIKIITGEDVKLGGASRTDAGVHALGQAANFISNTRIETFSLQKGLNSLLPEDIVIKNVEDVELDFDARRSAKGKTYRYIILNRSYPSAIHRNTSWFVPYKLDIHLMNEGAERLIGEKDFSSFRAAGCSSEHAIREILSFSIWRDAAAACPACKPVVSKNPPSRRFASRVVSRHDVFSERMECDNFIIIEVKGTAFLMHMVRIMVGTLVDLGRGKITLENFKDIIEAKDRTKAGMTAPPHGLFLKEVEY